MFVLSNSMELGPALVGVGCGFETHPSNIPAERMFYHSAGWSYSEAMKVWRTWYITKSCAACRIYVCILLLIIVKVLGLILVKQLMKCNDLIMLIIIWSKWIISYYLPATQSRIKQNSVDFCNEWKFVKNSWKKKHSWKIPQKFMNEMFINQLSHLLFKYVDGQFMNWCQLTTMNYLWIFMNSSWSSSPGSALCGFRVFLWCHYKRLPCSCIDLKIFYLEDALCENGLVLSELRAQACLHHTFTVREHK